MFDLPDADNNSFYICKDEIDWVQGTDGGWTIFGMCDVEGIEDENLPLFLAVLLIWQKQQKEGMMIEMSESGSKDEKIWGSFDYVVD